MTKREAKRLVCRCVAAIIDEPHPNEFLYIEGDDDRSPEDTARMVGALRELVDELERRGRQRLL